MKIYYYYFYYCYYYYYYLFIYLLIYLLTAIEFSLGGSSPYNSTEKN